MPVVTPTYGVFQGLYNGGGNTSFIGLYAKEALGQKYQVIGIVSAVDISTSSKTLTHNESSAFYAGTASVEVIRPFALVASKSQNSYRSQAVLLRQNTTGPKTKSRFVAGVSAVLRQYQSVVALIGKFIVSAPIIFQDYYDTYTNQEVDTVSYAEPNIPIFEEANANSTFQEGDVSSFTERKWNNT